MICELSLLYMKAFAMSPMVPHGMGSDGQPSLSKGPAWCNTASIQQSSAELTWKALQYHEKICGDAQHLRQLSPGDGLCIGKTISASKLPLQCRFCGTPTRLVYDNHHQCGCHYGWQGHNDKWPAPAQLRPCNVEESECHAMAAKKCAQQKY